MKAKMINTIRKTDKLTPQFFDNETQIRANMTGKTGSGVLIATLPPVNPSDPSWITDPILKEVDKILKRSKQ